MPAAQAFGGMPKAPGDNPRFRTCARSSRIRAGGINH